MYWGIGTLIILVMAAVLTIAAAIPLPQSLALLDTSYSLLLPCFLVVITTALILFQQRISLPILDTISVDSPSKTASKLVSSTPRILSLFKPLRYLIVAALVLALIIGSLLQALIAHQQLESTKITEPARVQAWVTIEGISDSVYDATFNSGYRQVATLSEIVPLTTDLSAEQLAEKSTESTVNDILQPNSASLNRRVLLILYPNKANDTPSVAELNSLQPGARVLMTLALAPLASSEQALNNPTGFDSYRWLRARHIDGAATIITLSSAPISYPNQSAGVASDSTSIWARMHITIDSWRLHLRQHFYQDWSTKSAAEQQADAVTLSLLTGDRSLINRETKDLYQLAGISHLLAISGTHVLFMAIMLAAMVVVLVERFYPALYRLLPRWQVRWWVMIASAFIYALFTGFDVPAARTAWMLLAIGLVRLTLVPMSTLRVLLALAIFMAWLDPYVLWQAGYWLSFIAVALLLNYEDALASQSSAATTSYPALSTKASKLSKDKQSLINVSSQKHKSWLLFKRVFRLQFWLFIALLPITLLLFGKASLWGLVINLFAIGLFGWIIVPLNLLAGLCYLLAPSIADSIWALVSAIVSQLHQLIEWLTTLPVLNSAWLYTPINFAMLLMAALMLLPWLLPRGVISRWFSLVPLTLLSMTIYSNQQSFSQAPTLYILPTGDRHITAAVLIYPNDKDIDNQSKASKPSLDQKLGQDKINWLFLADHRVQGERNMPSTLTAEKLVGQLEQQLRTLAIKHLDGIIVQSSAATMTTSVPSKSTDSNRQSVPQGISLLPLSVALLSQQLPTAQYWQAGQHERWQALQNALTVTSANPLVSAQACQQGQEWQALNGQLKLQALTGWSEIDDASVWDCSLAIASQSPITVVHYNASNPQQPTQATVQTLVSNKRLSGLTETASDNTVLSDTVFNDTVLDETKTDATALSRLILDVATHKRSWQLWSLLCAAEPLAFDMSQADFSSITWLSHSSSAVSAEVLMAQQTEQVLTYDEQPLEVALTIQADE
ncbi:ComEC/Rec2 family competence protein [Psychrobacter sp. 2Y5]|uniref:ComEC/Rec2 family competence protein n=1 Tax=unclassified Psychrobacter TaxID=196806 RepID=UPI003F458262